MANFSRRYPMKMQIFTSRSPDVRAGISDNVINLKQVLVNAMFCGYRICWEKLDVQKLTMQWSHIHGTYR